MCGRGGAGKRILVGQAKNTKLTPGGTLLHKSMNIGMAVAIPPAPSLVVGYRLNRLDGPIFMAVSKRLLTEFGIHHRLESCERLWHNLMIAHPL